VLIFASFEFSFFFFVMCENAIYFQNFCYIHKQSAFFQATKYFFKILDQNKNIVIPLINPTLGEIHTVASREVLLKVS
jgi:hypothetical protein